MDSVKEIKVKIENQVDEYLKMFPEEAKAFIEQIKPKQVLDGELNKFKGTDMIQRPLHEMPETLFIMIKMQLTDKEFEWHGSKEGGRWFAKRFKGMALTTV